jgi:hypothetical protein
MTPSNKIIFYITEEQHQLGCEWKHQTNEKIARKQLSKRLNSDKSPSDKILTEELSKSLERGRPVPNYGTVGGAYVYKFYPTSDGLIYKIKNALNGDEIDLTNFEETGSLIAAQITGVEYEELIKWQNSIEERLNTIVTYIYEFCHMTLGTTIKIICQETGEEIDVTDYSWW